MKNSQTTNKIWIDSTWRSTKLHHFQLFLLSIRFESITKIYRWLWSASEPSVAGWLALPQQLVLQARKMWRTVDSDTVYVCVCCPAVYVYFRTSSIQIECVFLCWQLLSLYIILCHTTWQSVSIIFYLFFLPNFCFAAHRFAALTIRLLRQFCRSDWIKRAVPYACEIDREKKTSSGGLRIEAIAP